MVPEPKKQATRGSKQIQKENEETIAFYTVVIASVHVVFLLTTFFGFWDAFTLRNQVSYGTSLVLQVAAFFLMHRMSRGRFTADGALIEAGVDLNMTSGMAEHLKDIILLTTIVQILSLLSSYFWLALLVVSSNIPISFDVKLEINNLSEFVVLD